MYTVTEAARLLRISRAFAYEFVATGDLPSLRLGRRVVIPRRALDELIDAQRSPLAARRTLRPPSPPGLTGGRGPSLSDHERRKECAGTSRRRATGTTPSSTRGATPGPGKLATAGTRPGRREGAADKLLNELVRQLHDGNYSAPDRMTLREYLEERWLPTKKAQIRPTIWRT